MGFLKTLSTNPARTSALTSAFLAASALLTFAALGAWLRRGGSVRSVDGGVGVLIAVWALVPVIALLAMHLFWPLEPMSRSVLCVTSGLVAAMGLLGYGDTALWYSQRLGRHVFMEGVEVIGLPLYQLAVAVAGSIVMSWTRAWR
jgi:hypothetical protein